MRNLEVKEEYGRIKEIFKGCDEKQMELLDGAFWELCKAPGGVRQPP